MSLTDNLYLKPKADGVTVRDPLTGKPLTADGASKPRTAYWLRRLRDGDVAEAKPPQAPAKAAAPTATKGDAK